MIFKNIFKSGVRILKCPDREDNKVPLVSAMGSVADTSDYDFDMFIVDQDAIEGIEKKMYGFYKENKYFRDEDKLQNLFNGESS